MTPEPKKVKIMSSVYREANDVIVWDLLFEDGTEQAFCWPSIDLLNALGIKAKATSEQLHGFCQAMQGKQINFVLEGTPQYQMPKESERDQAKISEGLADHFDTFKKHVEGTDGQ